jgi:hypothetical protein
MTSFTRITLSSALLLFSVGMPSIHALTPELVAAPVQDDVAYIAGSKAMDEHRWQDAVVSFDKVIGAKGKRVDAAVYWKAYSLNKLGKPQLAAATCDQLRARDPNSQWNRDCSALTVNVHIDTQALTESMKNVNVQVRAMTDSSVEDVEMWDNTNPPHGSDEDLKMLALNSLLNQDPARAIPLLRGVLTGNGSPAMKKHALFVLAQSKSPDADVILRDARWGRWAPISNAKRFVRSLSSKASARTIHSWRSTKPLATRRSRNRSSPDCLLLRMRRGWWSWPAVRRTSS